MATKKKKGALSEGWRADVNRLINGFSTAPPYGFTGRDPLSRATLPSPDLHRREMDKETVAAVVIKSFQILESTDANEAAVALLKAERRAGENVSAKTWCRVLAYGILHVTRLSMEKKVG